MNHGTVGVMQGLSSTMTANQFVIPVDGNTDSRTKLILRDPDSTANKILTNTPGRLLFDNTALATEVWVSRDFLNKCLHTSSESCYFNDHRITN